MTAPCRAHGGRQALAAQQQHHGNAPTDVGSAGGGAARRTRSQATLMQDGLAVCNRTRLRATPTSVNQAQHRNAAQLIARRAHS
eukprot:5133486-Alexandrium_andersonii.AAC.1